MDLTAALDPGQRIDPAALVIVEQLELFRDSPRDDTRFRYDVVHAEQWALGTPHPQVVSDVVSLFRRPELEDARLVFDATGAGVVYQDLFRAEYRADRLPVQAYPITITAGSRDSRGHVAKRNLVGKYEAKLSAGLIAVRDIPLRKEIAKQHERFRARISQSGRDTYEAAQEGRDHDDLLLALMLATHYAGASAEPRYISRGGAILAARSLASDPY